MAGVERGEMMDVQLRQVLFGLLIIEYAADTGIKSEIRITVEFFKRETCSLGRKGSFQLRSVCLLSECALVWVCGAWCGSVVCARVCISQ